MGFSQLWSKAKHTKTFRPARISIPQENIEPKLHVNGPFKRHQHYFQVQINQMYLTYNREWFTTWEPVVFAGSSFIYNEKMQEIPAVVGESKLSENTSKVPQGMIYENTKVAGMHPYNGGDFTISIILARAKRNDYLRKTLSIVEDISNTYLGIFGAAILPYLNVANLVTENFEKLIDSGDIEPIIGYKTTMSPDVGIQFNPGYFVLINEDSSLVSSENFFVKEQKLYFGETLETAIPYDKDDYVLYSVLAAEERSDVETLPYFKEFTKLKAHIKQFKSRINDEQREDLNNKLDALGFVVRNSKDLTPVQMNQQIDEFYTTIRAMIGEGRRLSNAENAITDPREEWELALDKKLRDLRKSRI